MISNDVQRDWGCIEGMGHYYSDPIELTVDIGSSQIVEETARRTVVEVEFVLDSPERDDADDYCRIVTVHVSFREVDGDWLVGSYGIRDLAGC